MRIVGIGLLGLLGALVSVACGRQPLEPNPFGCPEYLVVCDGQCTDTSRDDAHCGGCGQACGTNEECRASRCRPICDDNQTLCAAGCVDTRVDPAHCGNCDIQCAPGATCVGGRCEGGGECPGNQERCGDACVNTNTNRRHCGACFDACVAGDLCIDGSCQPDCGGGRSCDGVCVDLQSDPNHCGVCTIRCAEGFACNAGTCVRSCQPPLVDCSGACVDLLESAGHCGDCFTACGAGQVCQAGMCVCAPGQTLCAGSCVDLETDVGHCGACGSPCDGACNQGRCCPSPGVVCGDACVDIEFDEAHCGACGVACLGGERCQEGECVVDCPAGMALCGQDCFDLQTSADHCGGCDVACEAGEICSGGGCSVPCAGSTVECSGACVDIRVDALNCGDCGIACDAGLTCRAGECIDPQQACDFTGYDFPFTLNGDISVGDIAVDDSCNLYVGMQSTNSNSGGLIYTIRAATREVELVAEFPQLIRGLVYRSEDQTLYATSLDRLVAVGVDGSNPRSLDSSVAGQYLNGMTRAPANWGQYGGFLMTVRNTGEIIAFDPDNPVPQVLATTTAHISDLEFDGQQLYVAANTDKEIVRVAPGGALTSFVALPCAPDGLAVEPGVRLFAACGGDNAIYALDLPNGTPTLVGTAVLNAGWAPAGLLWHDAALFVLEEDAGLNALFP